MSQAPVGLDRLGYLSETILGERQQLGADLEIVLGDDFLIEFKPDLISFEEELCRTATVDEIIRFANGQYVRAVGRLESQHLAWALAPTWVRTECGTCVTSLGDDKFRISIERPSTFLSLTT